MCTVFKAAIRQVLPHAASTRVGCGCGRRGGVALLSLVYAKGDPTGITGLAYRDANGDVRKTGKAKQRPLDDFPGFALKWDKFNALEITRGCVYACP